jgi:hypothetical protein
MILKVSLMKKASENVNCQRRKKVGICFENLQFEKAGGESFS